MPVTLGDMSYFLAIIIWLWGLFALLHLGVRRGHIPLSGQARVAARAAALSFPFALIGYGCYGLFLTRQYFSTRGSVLYGVLPEAEFSRLTDWIYPQAVLFLVLGLWLAARVLGAGTGYTRGVRPSQELFLVPVLLMIFSVLGVSHTPGPGFGSLTAVLTIALYLVLTVAAVVLMLRSRLWAVTVACAGLLVTGGYGLLLARFGGAIPLPGGWYGFAHLAGYYDAAFRAGVIQGPILTTLGLWLAPRVIGEHTGAYAAALEVRAARLTERVHTLSQTRADAVDTAAAELRRIERDLHDGAQARLVALGMSLQAAQRLFRSNPEAAFALVDDAKEASSQALAELRDLVRGIYPPVLADRGLADAVRSLALDSPLHVVTAIDLPGEPELPVASAVYFAIAELLTNAACHSGARTVRIQLSHQHRALHALVTDDGSGGADPAHGTGLRGLERRLATFDGILAVNSPPGGPTIVVIEVPCALSSAKTSSC